MTARRCLLALFSLSVVLSSQALADIPPPPKQGRPSNPKLPPPERVPAPREVAPAEKGEAAKTTVPLVIKTDTKLENSKLLIPRKLLAGAVDKAAVEKIGWQPGDTRTFIAGIALSLAAASVLLMPRFRKQRRMVAGVAAVALVGIGLTATTWANVAEPPRFREGPVPPAEKIPLAGSITIEVVPDGDDITLVMSNKARKEIEEQSAKLRDAEVK